MNWLSPTWEKRLAYVFGVIVAVCYAVYTKQTSVPIPVYSAQVMSGSIKIVAISTPESEGK